METDSWGIVANVVQDRVLRTGAKVWIIYVNGDNERPFVTGISKGGRLIRKYLPFNRLRNFRAGWIPSTFREVYGCPHDYKTKAAAEQAAAKLRQRWQGD